MRKKVVKVVVPGAFSPKNPITRIIAYVAHGDGTEEVSRYMLNLREIGIGKDVPLNKAGLILLGKGLIASFDWTPDTSFSLWAMNTEENILIDGDPYLDRAKSAKK